MMQRVRYSRTASAFRAKPSRFALKALPIFALSLALLSGCAGPATPLGADWSLTATVHNDSADLAQGEVAPPAPPAIPLGPLTRPDQVARDAAILAGTLVPNADGMIPAPALPSSITDSLSGGSKPPVGSNVASRGIASLRNAISGAWGRSEAPPRISFDPPRQVLHGPRTIRVTIENTGEGPADQSSELLKGFKVRYHGHDVTRSFLMQAKVTRNVISKRIVLEIPSIRLAATTDHLIEMGYRAPSGRSSVAKLPPPICRAFEAHDIHRTDDFRPDDQMLKLIESISRQTGFSPAFTAALIAQESAFNPRSVSYARALGLTQVTPIAEEEISGVHKDWPRYPGLNEISAPMLKLLVMTGEVNSRNEWRLNPERSIRGGLTFAQMLADRWTDSEGLSKVRWASGAANAGGATDPELARTQLVLASYNSGYSRVLNAIQRNGSAWLTSSELREARKYVNRIFSYCDSFSQAASQPEPTSASVGVVQGGKSL
jgi:hypothetical protein